MLLPSHARTHTRIHSMWKMSENQIQRSIKFNEKSMREEPNDSTKPNKNYSFETLKTLKPPLSLSHGPFPSKICYQFQNWRAVDSASK